MKRPISVVGLSLVLVAGMTAPAWSLNDSAANAYELFLGQAHYQSMSATTDYWYKVNLVAGRSYAVYTWGPWADPSVSDLSLDLDLYQADGTTAAATAYVSDIEPRVEAAEGNNAEQRRIIPTQNDCYRIQVQNNSIGAQTVYIMVVETTLFLPWYYVNADYGYDTYIRMRNNTTSSLTALVTAYTAGGAVAGSTSLSIGPNGCSYVPVSSLGVTSGNYGSAQIAHSGGPGAIAANATTMSPITGMAFDSAFTPRMTWSTFGN